ncbi:polyphosphate kinase 2 family protein [Limobrevibacterium gyesilva]|uniref:Polyphosphate kinase 2 family protein n=1 Tax=Limobrevibacterium gyesilva TaxID=2991712 RepID=A0AA42CF70_9PROT|nr:polyphosphate kinase 2 family protein [Limobrevibacterium gyesilva]
MTNFAGKVLDRYRVTSGKGFRLKDYDPADTAPKMVAKADAAALLAADVARLSELQELLYPHSSWSLLCVFQGMDASGKDGTIKHVMSGVNPQGVRVMSFKAPGPEELSHDFLWRVMRRLPERGHIGIFNRSHYEEVLVARVHPEILARQHLPDPLVTKEIWAQRLEDITAFERYLTRQGTVILKFYLNISKEEQKRRLLERLDHPTKAWKFDSSDIGERARWDEYMAAYEAAIAGTATGHAPWFVVPADNKWFARLMVVAAMIEALENLNLKPLRVAPEDRAKLAEARSVLVNEE